MTDLELKKLKNNLWHSADILRSGANLFYLVARKKYHRNV